MLHFYSLKLTSFGLIDCTLHATHRSEIATGARADDLTPHYIDICSLLRHFRAIYRIYRFSRNVGPAIKQLLLLKVSYERHLRRSLHEPALAEIS